MKTSRREDAFNLIQKPSLLLQFKQRKIGGEERDAFDLIKTARGIRNRNIGAGSGTVKTTIWIIEIGVEMYSFFYGGSVLCRVVGGWKIFE